MDYENQIILNPQIQINNKKEENGIEYEEISKVGGEENCDPPINWPPKKFGKIVNTTAHEESINENKNCLEIEGKIINSEFASTNICKENNIMNNDSNNGENEKNKYINSCNNNIINDPSFDISIHVINKSVTNVKKYISSLKKIINNYCESDCENLSNDLKSECSSIVKTVSNFGGEFSDEKSCSENIDRVNIETLIQSVINKKIEEKKFTTLDIIDECLSIGEIYNKNNKTKISDIISKNINTALDQQNLLYSKHSGDINSKSCNVETISILNNKTNIKNSLHINELDFQKCVEDISRSLNIMSILHKDKSNNNSLNKNGEKNIDIIPDSCNPINFNLSKNKNNLNIEKNTTSILPEYLCTDTSEKTENNNEPTKKHLSCQESEKCENYKITDCLQKIKRFMQIGKGELSYDNTGMSLKREKKIETLLSTKKRISYFVLHILLFFSYIIFGFSLIFMRRIIYKIFFDQDL
ncbi:conserved Plasmodium protein, unknown function [Plasmodium vinckei vinckei]|uniref:Uncharacterized protein n=1 Tax=Plasmodium vinckei vinckei TaxID=54757 RepID=A0A449BSJ1_PLAVN|nr:conserved Plasmodium protein, unknown function [Plasmodium vinckei vinckei]KEG02206.1 hypothetical protein YYE_02945 [Plasmodium vinckei vinckei]VEV56447.1 conserved Plasmodium protein, unknown function [Plasmodium vinckei vinckei]